MNRSLLTPKWLALHVLFFGATVATGFLAFWQYSRAHEAGGSFQNLGYALLWPMFGLFTLYLWYRLAVLELRAIREWESGTSTEETLIPELPSKAGEASPAEKTADDAGAAKRTRRLVQPPAPTPDASDDPELAAYNEYLAELNRAKR